jgi:hypothetical protein
MWDELENALAWFKAAPSRWVRSLKQDLSAAAEWIWVVLQGDFAEEQTTAQTVTGTIISMIPFVDQICDVRDVVANCKKIHEDASNKWSWVALVLTLIGLFPTLGSLAKGCFKVMFAYGRKSALHGSKAALDSDFWQASKPFVEAGILKLNDFLARPEVRKTLAVLHWDNAYKELANMARKLAAELNVGQLIKVFDECIDALQELLALVHKWGSAAMQTRVGAVLSLVKGVRDQANRQLAEVLEPVQSYLNKLGARLDVEADMNYRVYTNAVNVNSFKKPLLDAEIALWKKEKPGWVDVRSSPEYKEAKLPKIPTDHPNVNATGGPLTHQSET